VSVVYGVFRSEESPGALPGPLGPVPKDHDGRLGYVAVDFSAPAYVREQKQHMRQFLPVGCYVVCTERDYESREWRIIFHKSSLRQLSNGERIPRWTQKFRDEKDDVGWWEEVT